MDGVKEAVGLWKKEDDVVCGRVGGVFRRVVSPEGFGWNIWRDVFRRFKRIFDDKIFVFFGNFVFGFVGSLNSGH